MTLLTELWINSAYLKSIWDRLDKDQITIRAEFDEDTKEQIKRHFREIDLLKQHGAEQRRKTKNTETGSKKASS